MVAIISYLLLKFYLMRLKMQRGGEIDEKERAEAIAKVSRIVNAIDFVLILWFKFLLWAIIILFATTIIALGISLFGTAHESAWIAAVERWELGTIAQLVGEYGVVTSLSVVALTLGVGAIVIYSILKFFFKKKQK